ncbi:MAG TPA: 30S ribosomal protein S4 [bacterium]|nr:30S ribosomal protein S4 [bacterium]HQL61963.1 30S ribosomal protein S4 [bacterium]
MARYRGPVCKLCRREGTKLMLKGQKCLSAKCQFHPAKKRARTYAPGEHGQRRVAKVSNYGTQLRAKQKFRRTYGVLERQFRRYFKEAARMRGVTGENLVHLLERRLDNVVYRLGFALSRTHARQLVRHNHVLLNGKRTNIPSVLVKVGDEIMICEKGRKMVVVQESLRLAESLGAPAWVSRDVERMVGRLERLPTLEEVQPPASPQLIVELYSK